MDQKRQPPIVQNFQIKIVANPVGPTTFFTTTFRGLRPRYIAAFKKINKEKPTLAERFR
jgi:hypothetical protein